MFLDVRYLSLWSNIWNFKFELGKPAKLNVKYIANRAQRLVESDIVDFLLTHIVQQFWISSHYHTQTHKPRTHMHTQHVVRHTYLQGDFLAVQRSCWSSCILRSDERQLQRRPRESCLCCQAHQDCRSKTNERVRDTFVIHLSRVRCKVLQCRCAVEWWESSAVVRSVLTVCSFYLCSSSFINRVYSPDALSEPSWIR